MTGSLYGRSVGLDRGGSLLWFVKPPRRVQVGHQDLEYLARDVALEAADESPSLRAPSQREPPRSFPCPVAVSPGGGGVEARPGQLRPRNANGQRREVWEVGVRLGLSKELPVDVSPERPDPGLAVGDP